MIFVIQISLKQNCSEDLNYYTLLLISFPAAVGNINHTDVLGAATNYDSSFFGVTVASHHFIFLGKTTANYCAQL